VPGWFGTIVSRGMATPHELDTIYGTQDVHDMLEIIAVDNANTRILNKPKD
jgi:hypothetical protein